MFEQYQYHKHSVPTELKSLSDKFFYKHSVPTGLKRCQFKEDFSHKTKTTVGWVEARNPNQEMYGTERLIDLTSKLSNDCSANEVVQHIVQDVEKFVEEAEQYDDLTLVVVKCTTPPE